MSQTEQVEAIKKRLTKAQVAMLMRVNIGLAPPTYHYNPTMQALGRRGLSTFIHVIGGHGRWEITGLGKEVTKAIIKGKAQ